MKTTTLKFFPCTSTKNNLYGSALSKPLPHSNFKWIDDKQIEFFSDPQNILALDEDGDTGYLFLIDLVYPNTIKDNTKDFPLAPESGFVTEDMFSPFMKRLHQQLVEQGHSKYKPCRKLLLP